MNMTTSLTNTMNDNNSINTAEEPTLLTTTTTSTNNNTSSTSNSNSSLLLGEKKRTTTVVVTSKRKEELLLRARAERKRWIRIVTYPYDKNKLHHRGGSITNTRSSPTITTIQKQHHDNGDDGGDNGDNGNNGNDNNYSGSFDKLQNSLICSNRFLSNATSVLSELYGITINDNDDNDDGHNNHTTNDDDDVDVVINNKRKYPLNIDEISDRVERLLSNNNNVDKNTTATTTNTVVVAAAAAAGQDQDQEGPDQKSLLVGQNTNTTNTNTNATNKKYNDLLKSYKEFTESMLLPESAVTVQGMKNFIRQFVTAAEQQKINDVNDVNDVNNDNNNNNNKEDALLRNMATSLNNHVRSSYESLTGTRRNSNGGDSGGSGGDSTITTTTHGGSSGQPDYDRRSLESFIYGQVKDVVLDPTLDRILGCNKSSTFPMTQQQFDVRLQELQFLQPSHLDIACLNDDDDNDDNNDNDDNDDNGGDNSNDSSSKSKSNNMKLEILLKEPIKALQSIEAFYSPYEKLQRVLDVFRGVNAALTKTSKTVPSADDVLPTVILVIVKAAADNKNKKTKTSSSSSSSYLKNLLRDLYFVECFALEEYLRGEAGYAFTNLYSAAQFLQELDLNISEDDDNDKNNNRSNNNSLSISSDELKRGLEKSRAVNKSKRNSITGSSGGTNGDFESHRQQKKGLISRGIDELLGGGDINNNNNNDATFAAIPVPPTLSVREVRAARLRGETLDLDWALRLQEKQPTTTDVSPSKLKSHSHSHSQSKQSSSTPQRYRFLGVRPENVKLSDLPNLLDEYRRLVLTTEELLGEQQRNNNRIQSERKRIRDEKHRRGLGERALLL